MTSTIARTTTLGSMIRTVALAVLTCVTATAAPQQASAQASPHADDVQAFFWDKSFLVRSGQGQWEERNASGATLAFTFDEIYGNADEIVLNDASRDVDLRIDLDRMAID